MNLELLPLDIFKLILVKLNQEDIFTLTLVGPEYHERLHDIDHFVLNQFYPDAYYTNNPWRQFVALHNNVRTYIDVNYNHVYLNNTDNRSDINKMMMLTGKILVEKVNSSPSNKYYNNYYMENKTRNFSDHRPIVMKGLIAENSCYWFISEISSDYNIDTYNHYILYRNEQQLLELMITMQYEYGVYQLINYIMDQPYITTITYPIDLEGETYIKDNLRNTDEMDCSSYIEFIREMIHSGQEIKETKEFFVTLNENTITNFNYIPFSKEFHKTCISFTRDNYNKYIYSRFGELSSPLVSLRDKLSQIHNHQ